VEGCGRLISNQEQEIKCRYAEYMRKRTDTQTELDIGIFRVGLVASFALEILKSPFWHWLATIIGHVCWVKFVVTVLHVHRSRIPCACISTEG
jgi:hypothetical protein